MNNHYKFCEPEPIQLINKYKLGFVEGNIVKYILRSPFKGERIKDLEKARYYALLLQPLGYVRCFNHCDLHEYYEHLLSQEVMAVEYVITSEIFGYVQDKNCNQVLKLIEISIKKRKEGEGKVDAE